MDLISIKISWPSTLLLLINTAKSMNYVTLKTSHDSIIAKSETRHRTKPATLSFLLSRIFLSRKLFSNIKIDNQKRSISDREDPINIILQPM